MLNCYDIKDLPPPLAGPANGYRPHEAAGFAAANTITALRNPGFPPDRRTPS